MTEGASFLASWEVYSICSYRAVQGMVPSTTNNSEAWAREQNLEAILVAAKAGLGIRLFLIIGLPREDISDLFRFLHEVNGITKNVLLQISLYRPIVGELFEQRITSGDLRRGTMHQLDFRTDCRRYGLDRTQDIVNFILLALAWPSTEISPEGNRRLQDRLLVNGGVRIHSGIAGQNGVARRDDIILLDAGERKLVYMGYRLKSASVLWSAAMISLNS